MTTPLGFPFEVFSPLQYHILLANVTKFDDNRLFSFAAWLTNPIFCPYVISADLDVKVVKKGFNQSPIILHFWQAEDDNIIPLALREHPFRHLPKTPMITNGW